MSNQIEKMFRAFEKFISENGNGQLNSKEYLNDMLDNFMSQYQLGNAEELTESNAETADDFLQLSELASTKKEALKYLKKAIELDRDNLDAVVMKAELDAATDEKLADKYKEIIENATKSLAAQGYFEEECIGDFWLITETRPYMRLLDKYAWLLVECGQLRLAEAEYKNMLRLCRGDNLGVRYRLMHIYAYFEDEQSAAELYNTYQEDSVQFLLPMSVLYYKLGDLRKSAKYLKMLYESNGDTYDFFESIVNDDLDETNFNMNSYVYVPYTIEEYIIEYEENQFLFICSSAYFVWAEQKLKEIKKKGKAKK